MFKNILRFALFIMFPLATMPIADLKADTGWRAVGGSKLATQLTGGRHGHHDPTYRGSYGHRGSKGYHKEYRHHDKGYNDRSHGVYKHGGYKKGWNDGNAHRRGLYFKDGHGHQKGYRRHHRGRQVIIVNPPHDRHQSHRHRHRGHRSNNTIIVGPGGIYVPGFKFNY